MLEFFKFLLAAFFTISGIVFIFRLIKMAKQSEEFDRAYKTEMLDQLQSIKGYLWHIDLHLRANAEVSDDA